ncbi:MAG: hypothetical protein AVDCRST_MAG05-155, partial [uncultured Rubrobacteraceae bacterium]
EGPPHGRHRPARRRPPGSPPRGRPRGPVPGPPREPERLPPGPLTNRGLPGRRQQRRRPPPRARRDGSSPARRRHRARPRRRRGRPERRGLPARGRRQHERALGLRVPLWPEKEDGGGREGQRARLDHRAPGDDLRLRAGQERPPPPALPGALPRLPDLRPRHEPLAARLPRGLRPRRLRNPRPPRRRRTGLRPARRLTALLRDDGRDGRPRPRKETPPPPASPGTHPTNPAPRRVAPAPAPRQERAGLAPARGQGLPLRRRARGPRLRPASVRRWRGPGGRPSEGGRPPEARDAI